MSPHFTPGLSYRLPHFTPFVFCLSPCLGAPLAGVGFPISAMTGAPGTRVFRVLGWDVGDHGRFRRSSRAPRGPSPSRSIPPHPKRAPATRAFRVAGQRSSQIGVGFSDWISIGVGLQRFWGLFLAKSQGPKAKGLFGQLPIASCLFSKTVHRTIFRSGANL